MSNQSVALPVGVAQAEGLTRLVDWVEESDDATISSRALAEKCRRYYDSEQWTAEEKRKLNKQKQAATVINRIKPKMDGLMGMEKANRTTCKAFPRTQKHEKGASAATEGTRFVLQDNFYHQRRSAVWENLLIEGTGGLEINVLPKNGSFKIVINQIMWDRLIYDPHSRRKDFSDARYLGEVIWMDYDEALAEFPAGRDVLDTMISGSTTYDDKPRWMDGKRRRVKIVRLYYRDKGSIYYATFTRGGYLKDPKECPFKNEEGEHEWPYEFASLFVDGDGGRYGAEKQLLDVQDEINKRRSKALHLMSVRQVRGERGAVDDVNKARQELAKPDGYIETTPGMEFEVLKTGDMAQAQFNLLTEAKQEIDAVSYNAAVAGKDANVQSGVALRAREMAGQTEVAPMFDVLKHLDIRVYRKVWNRIRQYWKEEMWIRVTDDPANLRWVGLNKPTTKGEIVLREAREKGLPQEQLQMLAQHISQDPSMQEMVTENNVAELDVDIVMADAPDTVTQEVEDFQAMAEMVKSGFPLPPKAVILASPLSNKDQILKMMDEQPQIPPELQKKMEQMAEQIEKVQEALQQKEQENQALKADQQVEAAKVRLQADANRAEMQLKADMQAQENELARQKAEGEFAVKKWIAEQEMILEERKLAHTEAIAERELALKERVALAAAALARETAAAKTANAG